MCVDKAVLAMERPAAERRSRNDDTSMPIA